MKGAEVRGLSNEEAIEKLAKLRRELAKERAIIESGTRPDKPSKIRNIKRDIARILTTLNERRRGKITNKKEVRGKK